MKKAYFRNSMYQVVLIWLLIFSTIAFAVPLVQADPIGIGKYANIKVVGGGGSVTLTKVSNGEHWEIEAGHELVQEKVGAGLVSVEAFPSADGKFVLDYWLIGYDVDEDGDIIEAERIDDTNYTEFRTRKGTTYVEAYFIEIFTVHAKVHEIANNGTIIFDEVQYTDLTLTVKSGTLLTLGLEAYEGSHISAITLDGGYLELGILEDGNLPLYVDQDYEVVVFFTEEGFAYVPGGDSKIFLTESASLLFTGASAGFASGIELTRPETWGAAIWDISTLGITYEGATITLELEGDYENGDNAITEVIVIVANDAFYCDVNGDLSVTAADLSLVANYNKVTETNPNEFPYDPLYDTNRDGEITEDDVHRVNEYKGTDLDYEYLDESRWDVSYDILTGITTVTINPPHFSIFRAW